MFFTIRGMFVILLQSEFGKLEVGLEIRKMNLYNKITRFYKECPREWNYYNETLGNPFDDS